MHPVLIIKFQRQVTSKGNGSVLPNPDFKPLLSKHNGHASFLHGK